MPTFRAFAEQTILAERYDYLVPIESKGMLLLQSVVKNRPSGSWPALRNLRAFDFLSPEELCDKRVAIVDDTLFTGRTLRQTAQRLEQLGVRSIDQYAFLSYQDEPYSSARKVSNVRCCQPVTREEFRCLADEFSRLSLQSRPSYPDHLSFRVSFQYPISSRRILDLSRERGLVAEYRRDPNRFVWSVHWPDWSPDLPPYATDTGLDKIRIAVDPTGQYLTICPVLFPALRSRPKPDQDPLQRRLLSELTKNWQDSEARVRNEYESFTLSLRLQQAANFLSDLRAQGMPVKSVQPLAPGLEWYFGPSVVKAFEPVFHDAVAESRPRLRAAYLADLGEGNASVLDRTAIAAQVVLSLRQAYMQHNSLKRDWSEYESVGWSVREIGTATETPCGLAAVVAEELNDYGYLTPIPLDQRAREDADWLQRSYRITETAAAWLYDIDL